MAKQGTLAVSEGIEDLLSATALTGTKGITAGTHPTESDWRAVNCAWKFTGCRIT